MEVWVINKALSMKLMINDELECLFRKQEHDVVYFDFMHITPETPTCLANELEFFNKQGKCQEQSLYQLDENLSLKINKLNAEEMNSSEDEQWAGVAAGKLPVIGYVKSQHPCNLTIYSLKKESAIHIWRFGSSIVKVKSSTSLHSNKAIVLLREGII